MNCTLNPSEKACCHDASTDVDGDRRYRRNVSFVALGEGIWGFQAMMVAPASVLTVLLKQLGAGELMLSSITAIEAGAVALPQILGMYLFYSRHRRQKQVILWHMLAIIPFWFMAAALAYGADKLPPAVTSCLLLVCFGGFQLGIGIVTAAWMEWMAHLFEIHRRGIAMGIAFSVSALSGFAGSLIAGQVIRMGSDTLPFALLYLAAGTLALLSINFFWFVRDPVDAQECDTTLPRLPELLRHFGMSLKDANFRSFLVGRMLAAFGFCILPFFTVYFTSVDGGGLSNSKVVSFYAAASIGTALAHLVLGKLGDRFGHRLGILLGTATQVVTLALVLVGSGPVVCIVVFTCTGFCTASGFLSHFNLLFETCPHDNRLAHITVGNLAMSPGLIFAPLLAGWAAREWGLRTLFVICLVLSGTALLWFILRLREPRHLELEMLADHRSA
ncbi:MAG: MFS transporter [Phycisphaeraceae bacterium]|nr:MFS transporter [Phycisphaeraceae bacterium]